MAAKSRFQYEDFEVRAEGTLDIRGRMGLAPVPVGLSKVRVDVRIKTSESDARLNRLADLVARYCPVDSMMQLAVPEYHVQWERME